MGTPDELPAEALADHFGPPVEPCVCYCLHCQREVNSADMWYQRVVNGPPGSEGFWMCPTANCGGAGFGFDIHPTDPDHPANAGWSCDEDGEDDDGNEDDDWSADAEEGDGAAAEYDPDEPQWSDEVMGGPATEDEDDLEGEEWKHGLQPGERLPERPEAAAARARWEAEQRKYDEPDRRPRTIDGSGWTGRGGAGLPPARDADGEITDDDIPF